MGLNRLIDAELDARNPRTAGRELPAGALSGAQVWALCAAALALYLVAAFQLEPIVRWLWPIPVAMFVVYPYLKRVTWLCHLWLGACTGLAPLGAWLAVTGNGPVGGLGAVRRAGALGGGLRSLLLALRSRRTTARQGLRSWATRFGERGVFVGARIFHVARRRRSSPRSASASERCLLLAGRGRRCRAAPLRALARPARGPPTPRRRILHRQRRHQRRLLRLRRPRHADLEVGTWPRAGGGDMIVGRDLEKRYGRKRALEGVSFTVEQRGFLLVTGPNGSGKTTLLRLVAGLAAPTRGTLAVDCRAGRPRVCRARAAALSRAHGAREPRALRSPLSRPRAAGAERDAARAVRALGRARRSRLDLLAGHDATARALPRAAPRPGAARPRRAVHRARRGRRRAARQRARRR